MTCLQMCVLHFAPSKVYIPRWGGRILVMSVDCPRQRLHGDFESAPGSEESEEQADDKAAGGEVGSSSRRVSGAFQVPM